MREAKANSNWAAPDSAYEDAMLGFVQEALNPERSDAFMDAFLPFQAQVAELGMRNSLTQTVLKLTLPGMPDIYQGAELWDLTLVDPDNRRPVDFPARARMLEEIQSDIARDRLGAMRGLMAQWQNGGIKLAITATLLQLRQGYPGLFADGGYEALDAQGDRAEQICAFARRDEGRCLLVATTRFPQRLALDPDWYDTSVPAPDVAGWTDMLTGRRQAAGETLPAAALFADLPVAVLLAD
jgi:(1->4)-alpha-D-glucan 1-alpha-D-glucosylmutase